MTAQISKPSSARSRAYLFGRVVNLLGAESSLQDLLCDPALVSRFAELSMTPVEPGRATPEALETFLKSEIVKWGKIIKAAGIEPQ